MKNINNINKKGISLIILIITMIVVIILAAVVILTLSKNNPIESAKEAAFKEDIRTYQDELNMYITKEYQMLAGQRDSKITATGYEKDSTSEEYNNSVYKYLSSFKKKYENKIAIENDEIVYIGRDKKEREWTDNIVKMNPMLTVKYVFENGEEAAPTHEETITDGAYEVDSPIIGGYEPDHYTVSDKIEKDTEITVTYYPWSEGLSYEELGDGTYTVSGIGTFTGENLVIPKTFNNKAISQIKANAFYGNDTLKNVICDNIEKINSEAFWVCKKLENVYLNSKIISQFAFDNCSNLTTLKLGKNINIIQDNAFYNCGKLREIGIYSNNIDVNGIKFNGCTSINEIKINNTNDKYKVIDEVLYSKNGNKIFMYPPNKEGIYNILSGVNELGYASFFGNKYLNKLEIPELVKRINSETFWLCKNLEYVCIYSEEICSCAFDGCSNLTYVEISQNTKIIRDSAFYNCSKLKEVKYFGTKSEWNNINKNAQWKANSGITKVICVDGEVEL